MDSVEERDVLLLLDDDPNTLSALKRVLSREPYQIHAFHRPYDALSLMQSTRVGVIISDQCMPQMEGHQFLRLAAKSQPDAVRIILSGYFDEHSATKVVQDSGAWRYIPKPWSDDELRKTLAAAFNRYNARLSAPSLPRPTTREPATEVE